MVTRRGSKKGAGGGKGTTGGLRRNRNTAPCKGGGTGHGTGGGKGKGKNR